MAKQLTAIRLSSLIESGIHRIGELEIQTTVSGYRLCHFADVSVSDLQLHQGPADARDISTYSEDGTYRFTKGQTNLKRGWSMTLASDDELRQALDQFYPACVGLFIAWQEKDLVIETLREKLDRQTGMYRFARSISDAGAQKLVQEVCGPAHQCAKRILWRIDAETPLDVSEASSYNGIPNGMSESEAIPLLCREACNHFVAECRKVSKSEAGIK